MIKMLQGDCRDLLRTLPDESVHCVVTSPPYWGLRDYGVAGQLGMESSLGEYVEVMVAVFREVRRVLRTDGTLWLNLGDSYASGEIGRHDGYNPTRANGSGTDKPFGDRKQQRLNTGLKPKDLCGIPWRVAFALQADGWYLRQDLIWSKPNPMPESVTDRCTKAHEYLFLLSKRERYYYDAEAIAEPAVENSGWAKQRANGVNTWKFNDTAERIAGTWQRVEASTFGRPGTRNKRSVWEVTTQPFSEAHFATFPPALIEPCIKAGCPRDGTVLDPFAGAGTTGLVADRLQRNSILIELNPAYAAMGERRIVGDAPLFVEIAP